MAITNRFQLLLAEKGTREKRIIQLSDVSRVTGVSCDTLLRWSKNQVTRWDGPVVEALLRYFRLNRIDDLLVYEPDADEKNAGSA